MVSASKIADRMPQLPDVQLPDIPIDFDDVTDRLKDITGAGRRGQVSSPGVPLAFLGVLGVLIAVFFVMRSRRSSADSDT